MLKEKQLDLMLGALATGVDEGDGLRPLKLSVGSPIHETEVVEFTRWRYQLRVTRVRGVCYRRLVGAIVAILGRWRDLFVHQTRMRLCHAP